MGGDAYLLDYVRTARGRGSSGGGLRHLGPLDQVTPLLHALVERSPGLDPGMVDDLVLGCATQTGEQGGNLARTATLLADWGHRVPGATVNRFCASGIDAVAQVAARIRAGELGLAVAGGVESASRVPAGADHAPLWTDVEVVRRTGSTHPGVAADLNATIDGFTREELDGYALESHHKAAAAARAGALARSLVPVGGLGHDELVRADLGRAELAALPPAFAGLGADGQDELALTGRTWPARIDHRHTAGTSPPPADGAALLLVGDLATAGRLGLVPRARIVASAVVAQDPVTMLTAGQEAVGRVLRRAGVTPDEVDVFEFAEAFAAPCLRFRRAFDAGPDRLNPAGGTIAAGHAAGATGAMLVGGCLDEVERRAGRYGVAGVSAITGLGVALLLDRG
ncbi:acetyl-CoA C-acyltransferase [Actinokineospora enzanensis]|uniref:acetyl-CoA C-acyltransferase n=1 Tax=Actinokineospora enzanensis TaxID=155975 RepID=UPI00035E7270|nr:acetyl-CoA C-acyltransferase [Actinokineospora enzanensis]